MRHQGFICLCFFFFLSLEANPFLIPKINKKHVTNAEYLGIQRCLRELDIEEYVKNLYASEGMGLADVSFYLQRCCRGVRQVLIDSDRGLYPEVYFEKIGSGGDSCIVTCAPFSISEMQTKLSIRAKYSRELRESLEKTGFNGYLLVRVGGYPNPTEREIQFAGVPYAFKIFMMVEAQLLGCNRVIWIDSVCLPLRDPKPLFDTIKKHEGLFYSFRNDFEFISPYIFPSTRKILQEETGIDCLSAKYVCSIVFGLKMSSSRVQQLVKNFYELASLGTPFLSCFPEEFVLTSLLGNDEYCSFHQNCYWDRLFSRAEPWETDSKEKIFDSERKGYFFYQRRHE